MNELLTRMNLQVPVIGISAENEEKWSSILLDFERHHRISKAIQALKIIFQDDNHPGMSATLIVLGSMLQRSHFFETKLKLAETAALARVATQAIFADLFEREYVPGPVEIFEQCRSRLSAMLDNCCGCVDCKSVSRMLKLLQKFKRPPKLNPHVRSCPSATFLTQLYNSVVIGQNVSIGHDSISNLVVPPSKDQSLFSDAEDREICALITCIYLCLFFFTLEEYITMDLTSLGKELVKSLRFPSMDQETPSLIEFDTKTLIKQWNKHKDVSCHCHTIIDYKSLGICMKETIQSLYDDPPEPRSAEVIIEQIRDTLWGKGLDTAINLSKYGFGGECGYDKLFIQDEMSCIADNTETSPCDTAGSGSEELTSSVVDDLVLCTETHGNLSENVTENDGWWEELSNTSSPYDTPVRKSPLDLSDNEYEEQVSSPSCPQGSFSDHVLKKDHNVPSDGPIRNKKAADIFYVDDSYANEATSCDRSIVSHSPPIVNCNSFDSDDEDMYIQQYEYEESDLYLPIDEFERLLYSDYEELISPTEISTDNNLSFTESKVKSRKKHGKSKRKHT